MQRVSVELPLHSVILHCCIISSRSCSPDRGGCCERQVDNQQLWTHSENKKTSLSNKSINSPSSLSGSHYIHTVHVFTGGRFTAGVQTVNSEIIRWFPTEILTNVKGSGKKTRDLGSHDHILII